MRYDEAYEPTSLARKLEEEQDFWSTQQENNRRQEETDARYRVKNRRRRAIARRNQEKALIMSRGYVAFLSFMVIISCITAGYYIKLQAEVLGHIRNISAMQTSLNSYRFTNDADEKRLRSEVDIAAIRDEAMRLGMDYAGSDQIVYYELEYPDYMTQYSEIP